MNNSLFILLDRGHLKIYNMSCSNKKKEKIQLIQNYENDTITQKTDQVLTDRAGRFGKGSNKNDIKGYGEKQGYKSELNKKTIKIYADKIKDILKKYNYTEWYFASSKEINNQILNMLTPDFKKKLKRNIYSDLVNLPKNEVLKQFNI